MSRVTPNQALQQTGHANDGSARLNGFFRVSRLLSFVFGEDVRWGRIVACLIWIRAWNALLCLTIPL